MLNTYCFICHYITMQGVRININCSPIILQYLFLNPYPRRAKKCAYRVHESGSSVHRAHLIGLFSQWHKFRCCRIVAWRAGRSGIRRLFQISTFRICVKVLLLYDSGNIIDGIRSVSWALKQERIQILRTKGQEKATLVTRSITL